MLDEIARNEDHVWNSKDTAKGGKAWFRQQTKASGERTKLDLTKGLRGLPKETQPKFVTPELAQMAAAPPTGAGLEPTASSVDACRGCGSPR